MLAKREPSALAKLTVEPSQADWFTRDRLLTALLVLGTLVAFYLCYGLIRPFIPSIAFALAIAVAADRPYRWLRARIRKDAWSAAIAVIGVLFLIVGPAALLATYVVQKGLQEIDVLRAGRIDWQATLAQHAKLNSLWTWGDQHLDLSSQLAASGKWLTDQAGNILTGSIALITNLVIMMFVLFFFFRDASGGLRIVRYLMPLSEKEANRIIARVGNTIRATVNGSLFVGLIQAILVVMYSVLGVPAAMLWAAATFLAALVPMFGTPLVWIPIAGYLFATGSWIKALILVAWGALAVGTIDNILYPYFVGDKICVHTVPTFFSIIGGISLFGAAGLILGPLTLAITLGLLDIWWWRTTSGQSAEHVRTEQPSTKVAPSVALRPE